MSRSDAMFCVLCARCSCSYTSSNSHACVSQLACNGPRTWHGAARGAPQDGAGSRGRRAARLRRNQPEPRRTSPRTSPDGRRNFGGRRTLGAGRREELLDAMQSSEYRSVRYWSKEINGTLTGGRKKYFF